MYYNSNKLVNGFSTDPKDILYLLPDRTEWHLFVDGDWGHILKISFEGFRADRVGDSLIVVPSREKFLGGNA